jgi:hypothetical protein
MIREPNREHMQFAALQLRVYPTTSAQPFWPINSAYPVYGAKLYTFTDDYEQYPATAMICVYTPTGALTSDILYIKIGTDWLQLKKNPLLLQRSEKDLTRDKGYNAQRK